jgi:DNA-binding protein Fis
MVCTASWWIVKGYSIKSSIERVLDHFFKLQKKPTEITNLYFIFISEVEKILIEKVLFISAGNKKRASEILGISRNTLRAKILKLNINDE